MATPMAIKRMTRERRILQEHSDDYFVHFEDDNLLAFTAYIYGPSETLYAHKVLKIDFTIPADYPIVPPVCKFIQHTPGRIHPNLYVEGKVCLSILGTWPGESWAQAMTTDIVLITLRSLLDNAPFLHEPGGKDDLAFNGYVKYHSWNVLLLDHLERETVPELQTFLALHLRKYGVEIAENLRKQRRDYLGPKQVGSRYDRQCVTVDFVALETRLEKVLQGAEERLKGFERTNPEMVKAVVDRLTAPMAAVETAAEGMVNQTGNKASSRPEMKGGNGAASKFTTTGTTSGQHVSGKRRHETEILDLSASERMHSDGSRKKPKPEMLHLD